MDREVPRRIHRQQVINKTDEGLILDIVLGIVGAFVGGWLFTRSGYASVTGLNVYSTVVAIVGSIILLLIYHMVFARRA